MRRGQMGCLWTVIKPVLLFAVAIALMAIVGFPWAVPLPGRETLTGEWVGELRSNSGPRTWLYMNLQMTSGDEPSLFEGRTHLGDKAALCTSRRRIDLSIDGYTAAWSGKRLNLRLRPIVPSPPELRFDVGGTWDGQNLELRESNRSLAETVNETNDIAAVQSPRSSAWIAATLRKGTRSEFDAACAALAGGK